MSTVMITGANRGIGLELVKRYAAAGDRVLACCRDPSSATSLRELSREHDVAIHGVHVSDADSVAALAEQINGQRIDLLINNAGTMGPAPDRQSALNMDFEAWAEAFAVNTMAPVRMMQAFMPNLRLSDAPKVVTITSQLGALSLDMTVAFAYSSSRAAVNKFMRLAAIELRPLGISVGLIHPGWARTDMGGPTAELSAEESAAGIYNVVANLSLKNSGTFWKWNGELHRW